MISDCDNVDRCDVCFDSSECLVSGCESGYALSSGACVG